MDGLERGRGGSRGWRGGAGGEKEPWCAEMASCRRDQGGKRAGMGQTCLLDDGGVHVPPEGGDLCGLWLVAGKELLELHSGAATGSQVGQSEKNGRLQRRQFDIAARLYRHVTSLCIYRHTSPRSPLPEHHRRVLEAPHTRARHSSRAPPPPSPPRAPPLPGPPPPVSSHPAL